MLYDLADSSKLVLGLTDVVAGDRLRSAESVRAFRSLAATRAAYMP